MANDNLDSRQFSRRELIRIAGLGGLTVAAAGVAGPLALPRAVSAAGLQDPTPEGFLAAAYAQRAQAMTTGNVADLGALYDPASKDLLAFEQTRANFFRGGLGPIGKKLPVLGYGSTTQLLALQTTGTIATARVYVALLPNGSRAHSRSLLQRKPSASNIQTISVASCPVDRGERSRAGLVFVTRSRWSRARAAGASPRMRTTSTACT
ncbi:MAG TPA: hypothetical protein VFW96_10570 [Thermomicrobiales bacterium]|nr:hypothetical protein [Thermomicrobiales bacterium]